MSITPGIDLYKKRKYLSISALSSFARCPRKYFYSSGCRLEPKRTTSGSPALLFGEAMHKAIPEALTKDAGEGIKAFAKLWDKSLDDPKRNIGRAAAMLANLCDRFRNRGITLLEPPKTPLAPELDESISKWELPFAADVGIYRDTNKQREVIPLIGRIDGMARLPDGKIVAVEYKTTSELSPRFFDGLGYSPQVLGYATALRSQGIDALGVMIIALRVSEKNTETLDNVTLVTPHAMQDFIEWSRFIGYQILACEEAQCFPKAPSGCYPYAMFGSHGFVCDYRNLCHYTPDWTQLASLYEQKAEPVVSLHVLPSSPEEP